MNNESTNTELEKNFKNIIDKIIDKNSEYSDINDMNNQKIEKVEISDNRYNLFILSDPEKTTISHNIETSPLISVNIKENKLIPKYIEYNKGRNKEKVTKSKDIINYFKEYNFINKIENIHYK